MGRYLVWSDIPNNVQMRWIEDDGRVTTFRSPSGYSNGNTFDYEGRQLSCEHGGRRVVRYEPNGTITVIAERFRASGSIRPTTSSCIPTAASGSPIRPTASAATTKASRRESETKEAVYRVDPRAGEIEKVTDEVGQPNGLCFSPDYKKLYVADTGSAARDQGVGRRRHDAAQRQASSQLTRGEGRRRRPTASGVTSTATSGPVRGPGVQVIAPTGERIGMIRLPETCANVCFGGARRNRLFMTASQSLYAVYVNTTGAHIA